MKAVSLQPGARATPMPLFGTKKNDLRRHESVQKALSAVTVFQQPVHRGPSVSGSADRQEAIASLESRSGYSPASAAKTDLPEPPQAVKGDRAGAVGVSPQLELVARQQALRVAVKVKGKILLMAIADIMAIHAEGNYVSLKYRSSTYLVRESLCSLAVKLKPFRFIQIHRSVLVNALLVDELWPLSTGEYRLRVRNGMEYVVTRRYQDNLRHLAYVWIGSERFVGGCR